MYIFQKNVVSSQKVNIINNIDATSIINTTSIINRSILLLLKTNFFMLQPLTYIHCHSQPIQPSDQP